MPDRVHYRCPVCRVIFPGDEYVCAGGWPTYDPHDPDAHDPPHHPTPVEPISPWESRFPFEQF